MPDGVRPGEPALVLQRLLAEVPASTAAERDAARLQEAFFGLFSGHTPDTHGWLEPVDDAASRPTPVAV